MKILGPLDDSFCCHEIGHDGQEMLIKRHERESASDSMCQNTK